MGKPIYMVKKIIEYFLELLFPYKCLGCKTVGFILCQNCIDKLRYTERETEINIIAVYDYRDPIIKKAIWNLKYYNSRGIGQKLGELLQIELMEEIMDIKLFSLGSPIYVIPVPISPDRKKVRGYNQSEIIARNFCEYSDKNIFLLKTNIIVKKSNTTPQAKITNRNKRLQNIKDAFQIKNPEQVKGKTIIIIDDVTTTGATMNEMMKILKKSGARKVIGFTVAH